MERFDGLLRRALQEDIGCGDATTLAVVPAENRAEAVVFGRERFTLSGSGVFRRVFELLDEEVRIESFFRDGDIVEANATVFRLAGSARSLLTGERTALNFLQRLCGVATLTRAMVDAVSGTSCRILDTRKTTPLWRGLEKAAVEHGGGRNHRFGLFDGILIKDNHIAVAGSVGKAVRRARANAPHTLKIEVEVEDLEGLEEAIGAEADIVLLDNFSLESLQTAVKVAGGRVLLEASGGVTLDRVGAMAAAGVDFISCGALTHSARAIDLTMEFHY